MHHNLARVLMVGVICAANMSSVWAQQPLPPDTPVSLSVTISDADKLWRGLRKLPVEEVEELMNKIRQQVATQTAPKPTEDKKDASPSKP